MIVRPLVAVALAISAIGFTPDTTWGVTTVLTVGIDDNFTPGPFPTETPAAAPSDDFLATVVRTPSEISPFDVAVNNAGVLHTFLIPPRGIIIEATLEFGVRGSSTVGAQGNGGDGIVLAFSDSTPDDFVEDSVYARTFGQTNPGPLMGVNGPLFDDNDNGLLTPDVNWTANSLERRTLDLANLPEADGSITDLREELTGLGFLDVFLGDDSAVDFITLTVTAVPEPSGLCLAAGSIGLGLLGRRRLTARD